MICRNTVFLYCVMICANGVALAEKEDRSEELLDGHDIKSENDTLVEVGPPDSHEAMNNREINPKIREKRSYEFLMGLINNNSKYEVTKVDPSVATENPKVTTEHIAASELLLELMVRIAAHPDQWDKVHTLLQKIDKDLTISKNVFTNLQPSKVKVNLTKKYDSTKDLREKTELPTFLQMQSQNVTRNENREPNYIANNNWPNFDEAPIENVKFVNTKPPVQKYPWQNKHEMKPTYPKNFSYHRVTGKPFYLNKNPKAYIAVSVIAPKSVNIRSKEDDLTLESELQQLKPWTHRQNLKNMATIRSKWVIQTDDNKKKSVAPKSL